MPDTRHLIVRLSSASLDADAVFLVEETPAVLAAVRRYADHAAEVGDGHASFRVAYLPGGMRWGRGTEEDLLSLVAHDVAADGGDAAVAAELARLRAVEYLPLTCVECRHVGVTDDFLVSLDGHDPSLHAEVVLAAWLARTARAAELDADEDDRADWEVRRVDVLPDRVYVVAGPNRGEDVVFSFAPPEA